MLENRDLIAAFAQQGETVQTMELVTSTKSEIAKVFEMLFFYHCKTILNGFNPFKSQEPTFHDITDIIAIFGEIGISDIVVAQSVLVFDGWAKLLPQFVDKYQKIKIQFDSLVTCCSYVIQVSAKGSYKREYLGLQMDDKGNYVIYNPTDNTATLYPTRNAFQAFADELDATHNLKAVLSLQPFPLPF